MFCPLTRNLEKKSVQERQIRNLPSYTFFPQIMSHFVEQRTLVSDLTKDESLNYAALAALTEGYAALDLKDLVSRAVQNAAERTLIDANGRPDYAPVRTSHQHHSVVRR